MNLPLLFARRYFLAPHSRNAVNVITGISIGVIAVVAAAMVTVLSTFNGIAGLVDAMYSPFDQDLTITPAEGKSFPRNALDRDAIAALPHVARMSFTLEENVLLRSGDQQAVATLKGVENQYMAMSRMADLIYMGEPSLQGRHGPVALLGIGLKVDLNVPLDDGVFTPLGISAPIRGRKLSTYQQRAFEHVDMAMGGAFSLNTEYDYRYVLVDLDLAADLLHYDSLVSALEIQLGPEGNMDRTAEALRGMLGEAWTVRTRHQKNALMFRTNQLEKIFVFMVLVFIGLIGAFNIIASLTMMMIEKGRDMRTLVAMGATARTVRRVFFYEGLLIVLIGTAAGMALGLLICWAQEHFGLVTLEGSVVDHYPVKVLPMDLLLIAATVLGIGLLATRIPLRALQRRFLQATAARA